MKKYITVILMIFLAAEIYAAPKPRFFITTAAEGDSSGKIAAAYLPYFETQVFNLIKKIYPCAEQNSLSTVVTLLDLERKKQLLGTGSDAAVQYLAESMGCDYLISLKVSVLQNTALITAVCMDSKKAKAMSRAFASAQHGGAALDAVDKVSKQLFDGLKEFEICPFTGPVKVKIVSAKKDNKTERYPVFCNNMDGTYEKTTVLDKYSENNWDLQKTSKYATTGTVQLNLSEELTIEETNPCHDCSPTEQKARIYHEKDRTYLMLEGLSKESESYGVKVDDARIVITFMENGKYRMRVKAASTHGEKKTIKEVSAEGSCDRITKEPETIRNRVDEGINEILGDFTGNAQDKTLSERNTIKRTNEITGEEEEITYEFNLTRE